MNTTLYDGLIRTITPGTTRRSAVSALVVGTFAAAQGSSLLSLSDAAARKKKRKRKQQKKNKKNMQGDQTAPAPENVCAEKNWCLDRTQTCGPSDGYGRCLVEATGGNLCAEILFQVPTCADCESPSCTNCRCALAAGGGDRCNNGANGYDFICVREVQAA
jgi:hypothetical protein